MIYIDSLIKINPWTRSVQKTKNNNSCDSLNKWYSFIMHFAQQFINCIHCIFPPTLGQTRIHTKITGFFTFIYHVYIGYVLINIYKMVGISSNNCKQIVSCTYSSQISGGIKA